MKKAHIQTNYALITRRAILLNENKDLSSKKSSL